MHRRCFVLLLLTNCLMVGCGGPTGPVKVKVTGTVTLNGEPLDSGLINFMPADGKGMPISAAIEMGRFSADSTLGEKRVEITSPKVIGTKAAYDTPDSPMMDVLEERIPPKYNALSELKATISKTPTPLTFELTADKP